VWSPISSFFPFPKAVWSNLEFSVMAAQTFSLLPWIMSH
jgi:hypothetical protein